MWYSKAKALYLRSLERGDTEKTHEVAQRTVSDDSPQVTSYYSEER